MTVNLLNLRVTMMSAFASLHFAIGAVTILVTAYFDRLDFLETHFFSHVHEAGIFRIGDYSSFGMYFTALCIIGLGYLTLVSKSIVMNKVKSEDAMTEERAISILERQNFTLLDGMKDLTEQPKSDRTVQVPRELILDGDLDKLLDQNIEENQLRH